MQDHLGGLNEQQRDAVLCKADIVYVNAGPGTGKTALLTSKLVDIIQTSTSPEKIVALSYTNTAARQIGERFKEKLAKSGISKDYSLFSGTIHSFCYRMLKKYSESFDYTILDDEELMELAEDISRRYNERFSAKQILACINAKQINLPDEVVQTVSGVKSAFKIISVQDILVLFIKALDEDAAFRRFIHDQVTVMAFDEAQDLTEQHYSILDRILSINPAVKVFLVGDPRQNIFEFNGGSYKNLDDFLHRHTSHVVKSLTITYRCGQAIADYVNTFRFTDCDNLQLQSRCSEAGRISIKQSFDEEDEARTVLESIKATGNLNSCAVLCNSLKYLENLISLLREEQIPYKVYGGRKTLKRHIRFLNHILRIIDNENPYSIRKIADYAGINILEDGKRKKSKFFASPLGQIIASIREQVQSHPFSEIATRVLSEIMMDPDDDASVQSDYMDFQTWSYDYEGVSDYLAAFATDRERFAQFYQADYAECIVPTDNGFLTLSTIHSAKGLEWDHVYIMGLCEGNFPNPYFCTAKTPEGIDEFFNAEWKKMYVASTRAKETLCLTYATHITRKGFTFRKEPSRFINN
jgi:DNA helicase-2/ATP-dependent DNA helicase PcrA